VCKLHSNYTFLNGKPVHHQMYGCLRYLPQYIGALGATRTPDPLLRKQMLYPLSYEGTLFYKRLIFYQSSIDSQRERGAGRILHRETRAAVICHTQKREIYTCCKCASSFIPEMSQVHLRYPTKKQRVWIPIRQTKHLSSI
jgi:hypothetical protein